MEENARIFLCEATFFRCCLSDNHTNTRFPFYPKIKIGIGSGNRKTENVVLD